MANLEIDSQAVSGRKNAAVVKLTGPIDAKTEAPLREALEKLKTEGRAFIVLDMGGVTHASDQGLSALVMAADGFKAIGGGLVMIEVPPEVRVVVDMLSLDGVLPTLGGDSASALESLETAARRREELGARPSKESGGLFLALEDSSSGRHETVGPDDEGQ